MIGPKVINIPAMAYECTVAICQETCKAPNEYGSALRSQAQFQLRQSYLHSPITPMIVDLGINMPDHFPTTDA